MSISFIGNTHHLLHNLVLILCYDGGEFVDVHMLAWYLVSSSFIPFFLSFISGITVHRIKNIAVLNQIFIDVSAIEEKKS